MGRNRYFAEGGHDPLIKSAGAAGCVFISYVHRDAAFATRLARLFDELGVDYWLDRKDMPGGPGASDAQVCAAIHHAVRNSTHLLAVLSTATRGSWWVPFEVGLAEAHGKGLAFVVHRSAPTELPGWKTLGALLVDRWDLSAWVAALSDDPADRRTIRDWSALDDDLRRFRLG